MREAFEVVVSLPLGHKEDTKLAVEAALKPQMYVFSVVRVRARAELEDRRGWFWRLSHIKGIGWDGRVIFEGEGR